MDSGPDQGTGKETKGMALKRCHWCKEELYICDLTDRENCLFGHSSAYIGGHTNKCKQCRNMMQRRRRGQINGDPLVSYHMQNWRR